MSSPLDPSTGQQIYARLLAGHPPDAQLALGRDFWGLGGVHGGVMLGLLVAAMRQKADGAPLRMARAQLLKSLREPFVVEVAKLRLGRTVRSWTATASADGAVAASANAIFAPEAMEVAASRSPQAPAAPRPEDCPVVPIPAAMVPFPARRVQVRAVSASRPFGGGDDPELLAWVRLTDDDVTPDSVRLCILFDALAPSYTATLSRPVSVPTVELTVRPGEGLGQGDSPWVLLRSRTFSVSRDGWVEERLDAWDAQGRHVGSGEQLRLILGAAP